VGITTWSGGCQQGACHVTIHPATTLNTADAAHGAAALTGCEQCHAPDWSVAELACASCHSITETVAPVTDSNLKASYIGGASIRLYPADAKPSSGLNGTFYKLNGGSPVAGTSLTIPGPSSGTQSHTIEYWSTDRAGNVEVHKTFGFTVATDTVAPVTRSDAKASYNADATIKLTATDNGSLPILGTYYQLDGGPVQTGTTATVPKPVSGTQIRTLTFWSVDGSGREELPHKSVTFTMVTDSVAPVSYVSAPLYDKSTQPTLVRFSALDPAPGSGVAQTYYKLSTGPAKASTILYLYGSGPLVVEYWSVDKAGNEELPHKTVTIIRDAIKPVTASDAKATYAGPALITLSPTDTGGSGVATTYYTVDGGVQQTGTSVTVSAPGSHTLRFWSTDKAGNIEVQKVATFSVSAL
jgi:hypothetical protein